MVDELEALRQLARLRRKRSFEQFRKRLESTWSPLPEFEEMPEPLSDEPGPFPRSIAAE
ncbi:MAG: hypothetical protein JOY81_04275 [Alphaproteobacteria bacterium]|nr:hypothetical protein [Alphaproteobacteria bacterium]